MNCVITAGPTYERLDEVRRLTNFSTGRLGSELGNYLATRGHVVTLLIGEQATWHGEQQAKEVQTFSTTEDLHHRLQALADKNVDALLHAAAVCDFTFGKVWSPSATGGLEEVKGGKISTRLDKLLVELTPTRKLISGLRDSFPRACLVGWKFEMDGDRGSVLMKAERQIAENRTDACVANGRAYGTGFGLVTGVGRCVHHEDATALYTALEELIRNR